jgi:hypothetical protein
MLSNASGPLDAAPPSPQALGGGSTGAPTPFSLDQLAPPQVSSAQMPPEILTGIVQSAQTIDQMFDSFAQVTPDQGPLLSQLKNLLATYLATLMQSGAGPTAPTATGRAFPAVFDRGTAGAGTQ